MLQKDVLGRLLPLGLFWGGYTLVFVLWRFTFLYTLPLLLGALAAAALQPVIRFTETRLHLRHSLASGGITLTALALLLGLLIFLSVLAVRELSAFLITAAQGGFPAFSPPVRAFFQRVGDFFRDLDGEFWERNRQELTELLKNSAGLALAALNGILGVLASLPGFIVMLLLTGLSAFFIARDYDKLLGWAKSLLEPELLEKLRMAAKRASGTGQRTMLSYLLIYFISFCEALVILSVLGIPYPLITAAITCAADVLPVLGPGIVFVPVAAVQLLTGEYGRGFGVMVGWLVMSCVRQVIEPKLVASSVKVHPLAMLAAVYFSLISKSIWMLFYIAGFFMLYSFLREAGILPPLQSTE